MKIFYYLIFCFFYSLSLNADIAPIFYTYANELPKEIQPCDNLLSNKEDCKEEGIFIDVPKTYRYKAFYLLIHTNLNISNLNDDVSIHLSKKDGSYNKTTLVSSKPKKITNMKIQRTRGFELDELFPEFPKNGSYSLSATYQGKTSNTIKVDININKFYQTPLKYDKNGAIDNSMMKNIMKEGQLIVYQNECDFEKAAPNRKNQCIEYPRRKNGRKNLRALGVFFNIPKYSDRFDFPVCARIHADYGYSNDDVVIHLEGNEYKKSKVYATKGKLLQDYKKFIKINENGKAEFIQRTGKIVCTDINELLPTPPPGVYSFHFTFRGSESNVVEIRIDL